MVSGTTVTDRTASLPLFETIINQLIDFKDLSFDLFGCTYGGEKQSKKSKYVTAALSYPLWQNNPYWGIGKPVTSCKPLVISMHSGDFGNWHPVRNIYKQ